MQKVALYVQAVADTTWLEKKVENPETGRIVKVKSLPPELQKEYRPKNTDKINEHTNKFKEHLNKAKSLYKPAKEEAGDFRKMKKFLDHVYKANEHVEKAKKHGFTESKESKNVKTLKKHVHSGDFFHEKLNHHIKQIDKHFEHLKPLISKSQKQGYRDFDHFDTGLTSLQENKAEDHHNASKDHFESAKFVRGILKKIKHPSGNTKLADHANKINSNGRQLMGWVHDDVDLK